MSIFHLLQLEVFADKALAWSSGLSLGELPLVKAGVAASAQRKRDLLQVESSSVALVATMNVTESFL